ncbi:MAG TPA: hypothetical protein VMU66_09750 [Gaiellales bacterium]|nr:hypothetical protein [Gaiellales bacterium]
MWQDRRTTDTCRLLPAELLRGRTGLVPDSYFSATEWRWLLDHVGASSNSSIAGGCAEQAERLAREHILRHPAPGRPAGGAGG